MTLDEIIAISEGKGYGIVISRGDCIEIEKIDELNVFEDDEAAVDAAIKDGIPIIPVEELPKNFGDPFGGSYSDFRYLGWIDTPENRAAITRYCMEQ